MSIQQVDNTTGAGEALNTGFDKVNQVITRINQLEETDDVTFNSATLSSLTSGRVVYAGANGLLQDSSNLTFDGTNLALASATFGANNALTGTLGDTRYGQLGAGNTWSAVNTFSAGVIIGTNTTFSDSLLKIRNDDDTVVTSTSIPAGNHTAGMLIDNLSTVADMGSPITWRGRSSGTAFASIAATFPSANNSVLRFYVERSDTFAEAFRVDDSIVTQIPVEINGTLDVTGIATFGDDVEKDNFALTTDFDGTGWQALSAGDFNIRNLIVRESARFRELIIDQLSIIAGSDLLSVARGKIASIDTGAKTVTIEDPNDRGATRFVVNDFFWVKSVDIDNSTIVDLKGQITAVSGTTLTLDTTVTGGTHDGATTDITSLTVGDVIAQRGHPTNADRQSLIYRTVSDSDAPVEKFFDGIDSLGAFDTASNIVVEIGPTSGHFGANNILTYSPDEVGLASFTVNDEYLTDGKNYIGFLNNVTNPTNGIIIGELNTVPVIRLFSGGTSLIQLDAGGGADGALFRNSSGTTVARFGSQNYLAGLNIEGDLTTIDGGRVIGRNSSNDLVFSLSPSGTTFWNSSGAQVFSANSDANEVRIAQRLRLDLNTATSASAGGASALPSEPETYISVDVNDGGTVKTLWIPAYDSAGSPPSAPSSVSLCQAASSLRVSWGSVSGATGYIVERATSGTGPWSQVADTASTSYDDPFPPFNSSTTYFYRIFAYNANGSSGASSTVSDSYDSATAC